MIRLETHDRGVILPVKAHAGARRNGVTGEHDGLLKLSVTQAPEKGKANKSISTVLADALRLAKSQVKILSGETGSHKKFLITGIERTELASRLSEILNE